MVFSNQLCIMNNRTMIPCDVVTPRLLSIGGQEKDTTIPGPRVSKGRDRAGRESRAGPPTLFTGPSLPERSKLKNAMLSRHLNHESLCKISAKLAVIMLGFFS